MTKKHSALLVPEASKVVLIVTLLVFVIVPFVKMVIGITAADYDAVVHNAKFASAIKNTFLISFFTTLISVLLGTLVSFCLQRTNVKAKPVFSVIFTLPMLIPSISLGTGLIVLFGNNGILTKFLQIQTFIYGYSGVIIGSVLYSFPVSFLMINDVLKYEDSAAYDAADVMGISKVHQFLSITLPYLARPLIATFFSVFTMVATDYGVPLMLSGKIPTLAVMLYQEVLGQMNFGTGSVIGIFLLVPALVAFVYNLLSKSNGKMGYVTTPFFFRNNWLRDGLGYLFCSFAAVAILSLVFAFIFFGFTTSFPKDLSFSLAHLKNTFSINGAMYLKNSLWIALVTSCVGMVVTFIDAYLTTRLKTGVSHVLHLFSITSLAIPGLVLGLAYIMAFKKSVIYGTYAIIIFANVIHFFASPYLMVHNSLEKMNENIENVGRVLGISRIRIIARVIMPMSVGTLVEVFAYFFVNSMMTISAVSFLFTYKTKPISMAIGQFEAQMQLQSAAIVSLIILAVNFLLKTIISIGKDLAQKKKKAVTGVN